MIFDRRTAPLHFAVRLPAIAHYLGQILLASSALMLVPLVVAMASGNFNVGARYLVACALLGGFGRAGARLPIPSGLQKNEALCIAALTFLLSSFAVAIPLTGYGLAPLDAWFDAVSAVTTTGLSTLPSVEGLPFSFHFGRSWAQWVGGLGVVVLSLAFVLQPGAATGQLGFNDREADDVAGGTRAHAKRILYAYIVITVLSVILIWAAGMPLADALTDGLAAVSTGGFAARDSSLGGLPPLVIAAVSIACLLGALPFYLYYQHVYRHWRAVLADQQLKMLAATIMFATALLYMLASLHTGDAGLASLGNAAAMVVSAQTTAGFSTVSVNTLGPAAILVLCASMLIGGALGSTAGGIKIMRLILLLRLFQLLLVRASTAANSDIRLRLGAKRVSQPELEAMLCIVLVYFLMIGLSWLIFVAAGYPAVPSLFEVTSAMGTAGLSAGVTGPDLPGYLKIVLCLDMLLGRVEAVGILILLFPGTWIGRRRKP